MENHIIAPIAKLLEANKAGQLVRKGELRAVLEETRKTYVKRKKNNDVTKELKYIQILEKSSTRSLPKG